MKGVLGILIHNAKLDWTGMEGFLPTLRTAFTMTMTKAEMDRELGGFVCILLAERDVNNVLTKDLEDVDSESPTNHRRAHQK
jgi:hypothetical protein